MILLFLVNNKIALILNHFRWHLDLVNFFQDLINLAGLLLDCLSIFNGVDAVIALIYFLIL